MPHPSRPPARALSARARALIVAAVLAAAFLTAILLANYLTSRYGLVSALVPTLLVPAGTYAAGLTFGLRDALHDRIGIPAVLVLIALGAGLSAVIGDGRIALASGVAFVVAELLDLAAYRPLRARSWVLAVVVSNTVGAVADTFLFLSLSGLGTSAPAVAGQVLVKAGWATLAFLAVAIPARALSARRRDSRRPVTA